MGAVEIAVLDDQGVITWVNDAWREFGRARGARPDRTEVGASYLDVCDRAGDPTSQRMATAIRSALGGASSTPVPIRVPCDEPGVSRTFTALVGSRLDDRGQCTGATVTLLPDNDDDADADAHPGDAARGGALAMTRATLLALTEAAPEGLVVVDAQGTIVHVNAQLELMAGHHAAHLVGQPLETLVPERLRVKHHGLHEDFRRSPRDRLMGEGAIMPLLRADGGEVPVQIALRPGRVDGREVVLATVRDLTERSLIESRLRDSEQSFRQVFEEAPIPAAILTLDREPPEVRRANPAFATLFGDGSTHPAGHRLNPSDDSFGRLVDDLRHDPTLRRTISCVFRHPDGSLRWAEVAASVVSLPNLPSPALLAFFLDVTERRLQQAERERRAATKDAVARITTAVLTGTVQARIHALVLDEVVTTLRAQSACLGFVSPRTTTFREVARVGPPGATPSIGVLGGWTSLGAGVGTPASPEAQPSASPEVEATRRITERDIVARFDIGSPTEVALIACCRAPEEPPFTDLEMHDLGSLTRQLALAVRLGQARADQERLALIDERQRISVDLHDTVIQDLIGIGLQLQFGEAATPDPAAAADHREALLDQLDRAVRRLRGIVFELHQSALDQSLTQSARTVTADAARALGFDPTLTIRGPVDAIPALVAEQVIAVLREALANVARHADATSAAVRLIAQPDAVVLLVDDDGRGMSTTDSGGHGLANMTRRARDLGGSCAATPRTPSGTRIEWRVPLGGIRP